jgi:hypothetical protein
MSEDTQHVDIGTFLVPRGNREVLYEHLYRVIAVDDEGYKLASHHGGTSLNWIRRDIWRYFRRLGDSEVARIVGMFEPVHVTLDTQTDFSGFPAWSNGTRRDGWAIAMFEKDALLSAIADRLLPDPFFGVHWDAEADAFLVINGRHDGLPDPKFTLDEVRERMRDPDWSVASYPGQVVPTTEGPKKLYGLAASEWCWRLVRLEATAKP